MKLIKSISKSWWVFVALVVIYAIVGMTKYDGVWTNSFLQVGAILLTIIFTLLLTLDNNKQLARQTREQIDFITKNTDRQIEELKRATELEIKALHESTDRQIENYQRETRKLVEELQTNSELLAGILQRQLEEAIESTHKELNQAQRTYKNLNEFRLLRTQEEKVAQLNQQKTFIDWLENKLNYFKDQYNKISSFVKRK